MGDNKELSLIPAVTLDIDTSGGSIFIDFTSVSIYNSSSIGVNLPSLKSLVKIVFLTTYSGWNLIESRFNLEADRISKKRPLFGKVNWRNDATY